MSPASFRHEWEPGSVAAARGTLEVGANYPWPRAAYGTWFGGDCHDWVDDLDGFVGHLTAHGVTVFRIFLACNAWNFGQLSFTATPRPLAVFEPPRGPSPAYARDLTRVLTILERHRARAILVLLDFLAFGTPQSATAPGGCGGRSAIALDTLADGARASYLEHFVEPLLRLAAHHRSLVYAWEPMNEPLWVTTAGFGFSPVGPVVSRATMGGWLDEVLARIHTHGMASTVGHARARDLAQLPSGTIPQFHFYPSLLGGHLLPPFARTRALLGEVSTRAGRWFTRDPERFVWPELLGRDTGDPTRAVAERLALTEARGYQLALLWPDGGTNAGPDKFSPAVLAALGRR